MRTKKLRADSIEPSLNHALYTLHTFWLNIDFRIGVFASLDRTNLDKLLVLHPIITRPIETKENRHEVIAGHRSYQIAKSVVDDQESLTCIEMQVNDEEALILAVNEVVMFFGYFCPFTSEEKIKKELYSHLRSLAKASDKVREMLPKELSSASKLRQFLQLTREQTKSPRRPASKLTKSIGA